MPVGPPSPSPCVPCEVLVAVFSGSWVLVSSWRPSSASPTPSLSPVRALFCHCPGLAFLTHSCHFFLVL